VSRAPQMAASLHTAVLLGGSRGASPTACPPHPFLSGAMHYSRPRGANGADVLPSTESFSV